jgi:hypothetical protein
VNRGVGRQGSARGADFGRSDDFPGYPDFSLGIVDRRDTRTVLGIALSAAFDNLVQGADTFGVFRT